MTKPSLIFMGTPDFALPALRMLHSEHYSILSVVTQPDRKAGRGQKEAVPPVKLLAEKYGLPVLQPQKVKDQDFLDRLYQLKPDMVVVAAFGQILPKAIIGFPRFGCLNIHPSLLPKYRGAAPLNWSIIRGETKTGVTIMLMDEGMDSGDILAQEETPIGRDETFGELHDRLSILGATLLIQTIDRVIAGTIRRQPQEPPGVTFAPRLTRETGKINWHAGVGDIVNLIRGMSPTPAAYTMLEGQTLKIFSAFGRTGPVGPPPGTVGTPYAQGLPVAAQDGYVTLKDIQLAGRKRMSTEDFLRGYRIRTGSVLG
jgi:methionyl-tRNA formyltransferase